MTKINHSTKYAPVSLNTRHFCNQGTVNLLNTWNQTVNNCRKNGRNIALHLHVEHRNNYVKQRNNYVKQRITNLGPNMTERSVSRICHAESGMRKIMETMDNNILRVKGFRKYTHSSTANQYKVHRIDELVNRLVHEKCIWREWF